MATQFIFLTLSFTPKDFQRRFCEHIKIELVISIGILGLLQKREHNRTPDRISIDQRAQAREL